MKPWQGTGFWNDDTIAQLKKLWGEGQSASQISLHFGGEVSRNAVIGKASRLGLHRSTVARRTSMSLAKLNAGVRAQMKPATEPKPAKPKLQIAGNGTVFERADSLPKAPPISARAWAPLPGSEPRTISAGLSSSACRWPVDLAGMDEQCFCARKTSGAGPYCSVHEALSRPRAGAKEHLDQKLGIAGPRRAA